MTAEEAQRKETTHHRLCRRRHHYQRLHLRDGSSKSKSSSWPHAHCHPPKPWLFSCLESGLFGDQIFTVVEVAQTLHEELHEFGSFVRLRRGGPATLHNELAELVLQSKDFSARGLCGVHKHKHQRQIHAAAWVA